MDITKIDDKYVEEMIDGIKSNCVLREGICSMDISNIDTNNLSVSMFKKISFNEETIFSKKQIEKFKPFELLERAKKYSDEVEKLHKEGINGNGVKIAVIDSNINLENEIFTKSNIEFIETEKSGEKETHGLTVLSALLQVAPLADVVYYANNKYDRKNKDENIFEIIKDVVERGDVKIISFSSSFRDENIKDKAYTLAKENGIAIIDSDVLYDNFTYCFRDIDENGNEKYVEAFLEPEEIISKEMYYKIKEKFNEELTKYNIDVEDNKKALDLLNEKLLLDGKVTKANEIMGLKNVIISTCYDGIDGMLFARKKDIRKQEREDRNIINPVEIPCGGRTFVGENNKYKYFSTCSASYTIPQLAAIYALAKEQCMDLSFDEFVDISKRTAINTEGRKVISPSNIVKEVEIIKNDFKRSLKSNVNLKANEVKEMKNIQASESELDINIK